jgi:signal transduction histidine kinase
MSTALSSVVSSLLRLAVMPKDDWDSALQQLLEIASDLLELERVNYWHLSPEPACITCELGYVRSKKLFEHGGVLRESDCGEYFAEIRRVQVMVVEDTRADPRARALAPYLESHRVGAMLDIPVFAQGKLVGDLCFEHVGGPRRWTPHDVELALTLSHSLTALLEVRARNDAERAERRSTFLAQTAAALAATLDPTQIAEIIVRRLIPELGDMGSLIAFDGERAWRVAHAHVDPEEQKVLGEMCSRYGGDIEGPGLGVEALRQKQSLLMPCCDAAALRALGLSEEIVTYFERLHIRGLMAVLMCVRTEVTGVLTVASRTRSYDRDDLRFAESYAEQVAIMLENTRLLAQAREAIRARDDFLQLAGHELRTPLTALNLAVDLLRKAMGPPSPAVQRAVDTIDRQSIRLARLTELIALAAQSDAGEPPLQIERLDLAALVREVALEFEDMCKREGCVLRVRADDAAWVEGDPTCLAVVVSNLIGNAVKFGPRAPIDVVVSGTEERARLVVADHGIGIPPSRLGSVFGRYVRAVSSQHFGGLGLGLYIASKIVAAHGGTIGVDSTPGAGATFTFDLPRSQAPREAGHHPSESS